MGYIVQKFGGTSLATLDLIKKAATRVKAEIDAGHSVITVVSAMAGTTNTLVSYVRDLSTTYDRAEYDAVVSTGEQITAGLLAIALQNLGLKARSWQGWQLPIHTSPHHTHAHIEDINVSGLIEAAQKGLVSVVAGFQGLSPKGRITTLGRGGSDTTAVALAAALKAERCDIFTDVDGIYTADPNYVVSADKLNQIAYQDMLELASQGAKVLQKESVEFAMKHQVRLRVLSSLSETPGTLVTGEAEIASKRRQISGLAHSLNYVQITLGGLPASLPYETILTPLRENNTAVDMVQTNLSPSIGKMDVSFIVLASEADRALSLLDAARASLGFQNIVKECDVATISVIGAGLQAERRPPRILFQTLKEKGIPVQAVSASEIKLSVLIPASHMEQAISSLHTAYQLDKEER